MYKMPNDGIERPKRLRDYPAYTARRIKGFVKRLFFIIGLVWRAAPLLLVTMAVLCLLDGVLPVVGAYISKDLLNEIAALIEQRAAGSLAADAFVAFKPLVFLFTFYLYTFS